MHITAWKQSSLDGHTFVLPEMFFSHDNTSTFIYPTTAKFFSSDNDPVTVPAAATGAIFRLSGTVGRHTYLLIQFVRPTVWRITFDPRKRFASEYKDYNSRTVIMNTLTTLRAYLDEVEDVIWDTAVTDAGNYYSLQSLVYNTMNDHRNRHNGNVATELRIYKSSFRIEAVREVEETRPRGPREVSSSQSSKVVWSTPAGCLGYKTVGTTQNIIFAASKPGSARYMGFGEQGGQELLKKPTFMNYFNFDNMMYSSVYGIGPKDSREPLYHSEPYWLELGGLPGFKSQVSTFIDNYSQTLVDFLSTNPSEIKTAVRFGELQYFVFAGDTTEQLITHLTSIIGKSRLKPRYVLGHHQGSYGYDTRQRVLEVGHKYVLRDIPLDAIHIDVDIQDDYQTFTIDENGRFPRPVEMFSELRALGIVCSTNITPVINNMHAPSYQVQREGLERGYFIPDVRYNEYGNGPVPAEKVRYSCYEGSVKLTINPKHDMGQFPGASYDFASNYNSGKPFRGGVGYGGTLGAPGYYLDLNVKEVREYWGKQYEYLFAQGLEFVWQDMTTPAIAKEYGDLKGFPFRLMVSDDTWEAEDSGRPSKKPAIEIWALYSYNLHKATYEGLNNMPIRNNKRNFIIGRGSFAGQHRYAGLWTGDNASTWDHFQISICQVLALGISGNEITGADIGGFMPAYGHRHPQWADPELLIRWYCAYSLLPWFRNHYHGKPGMKIFQEPWAYTDYIKSNSRGFSARERSIWLAVEPVCRYYIKLRYSLLQLLYDAMFEHQFNGLPIARALVLTDDDVTLLQENDWCLGNEYMVRRDLLVCPVMQPGLESGNGREIYLPRSSSWYPFNLGINPAGRLPGRKLKRQVGGGDTFFVDAHISADHEWIHNVCPMYIREGAIIPQIAPRQSTTAKKVPNPVSIHFYPGDDVDRAYSMYLDDGASRSSAPRFPQQHLLNTYPNADLDPLANSEYREVLFRQQCTPSCAARTITMTVPHDGYGSERVKADIGEMMTFVIWHDPELVEFDAPRVEVLLPQREEGKVWEFEVKYLEEVAATKVRLPVDAAGGPGGRKGKVLVKVMYK
ncbi:glycosyl hydrolases family 31-domain-containing protein [Kalaharituber pfeilii]|nr:glycosyl hydrolases family 31-domain-containing protein [Kalaharituber pfeilii]